MVILPGDITGDLKVNDTDLHHSLKTSYREKKPALMIGKSRENPDKIPSPSRDEIMKTCKAAFEETIATVAVSKSCVQKKWLDNQTRWL